MSNTPETDAESCYPDSNLGECVCADFARKLERERDEAREAFVIATDQMVIAQGKVREANKERDEAREKIKRQTDRIRYLEGATNHACGTPLSVALRERDEARKHLEDVKEYGTDEINAAVDLRQKLAQALVECDEERKEAEYYKERYEQLKETK